MNCADGVTFSTTRPGLLARNVGGLACAVRSPRRASVAVRNSRMLEVKIIVLSKVFTKVENESKRDPQDLDMMCAADDCVL